MKIATAILMAPLGISAPAAAQTVPVEKPIQLAQAEVRFSIGTPRPRVRERVIVREDRGLHRGWRHSRHWGQRRVIVREDDGWRRNRTTTIVKRNGPFVQKKVIMQQDD